mgnify:CR=1 FL=1
MIFFGLGLTRAGGGFPDIQTLEPLAQTLGISILELMRSEKIEQEEEQEKSEIQYTQKEVVEMLQNAGDISKQQEKRDRNANVIAGLLVFGVAAVAWAAKLTNLGGGLVLGGLVVTVFVSLWYFFQNMDDKESRRIYGAASVLSVGILMALIHYAWGDRIAEALSGTRIDWCFFCTLSMKFSGIPMAAYATAYFYMRFPILP